MAGEFAIVVEGLRDLAEVESLSDAHKMAIVMSVNRTAERTRTRAADQMRKEVSFSSSYLNPSSGRFGITSKATRANPEAVLRGRDRPTSLARFARGGQTGEAGVTVEVAPGAAKFLPKAFLVKLRAGTAQSGKSNTGLAIRLKPGETPRESRGAKKLANGLYLLYGPSVDQVFRLVRGDQIGPAEEFMRNEYFRQLDRLT